MRNRWGLCALFFAVASFGTMSVAHAGAWTQPEGEHYAKVWALALVGAAAFDAEGEITEVPDFRLFSMNYYAEYGLSDAWTVVSGGRPVGHATFDGNAALYVGDLSLGVRRGFLNGPVRLGIEGQIGYQGAAGDQNLAPTDALYTFKPAVASATGRLEGQLGITIPNGWISANLGVKAFTSDEISTAVVGSFQIGYTIAQKVVLDLHFPVNIHTGELDSRNITGSGESDYVGAGLGVSWWVNPNVALNVGFDGVLFARSNLATPALTFGVEFR